MRRLLVVLVVAWLVLPGEASADERGTRRQIRADRACQTSYALRARRGLTERERRTLARRHCTELAPGLWVSDLVFQA